MFSVLPLFNPDSIALLFPLLGAEDLKKFLICQSSTEQQTALPPRSDALEKKKHVIYKSMNNI